MATFRPSALARIILRLEEGGAPDSAALVGAIKEPGPAGLSGAAAPGVGTSGRPAAVDLPNPSDPFATMLGVVPLRANIVRAGIGQPDTCSLAFDANYLPLDPRAVRAAAADVYLGQATADAYARGMVEGNAALSTVPSSEEFRAFVGWADSAAWRVDAGEVELELSGLQRLLADSMLHPGLAPLVDIGRPLDLVVADLLQLAPMARGMRVVVRGVATKDAIPDLARILPRSMRSLRGGGYRLPVDDSGQSYWQIITRLCGFAGWVAFVELDTLILQPPRTLFVGAEVSTIPQWDATTGLPLAPLVPFRRALPSGEVLRARRMVFGENIATLEMVRPWGETNRRAVELRCYVPGEGRTLVARFPTAATVGRVAANGQTTTSDVDTLLVHGISTQAQLEAVAEQVWSARALNEINVTLTTHDLWSLGGEADGVTDILTARPGDTVELRLAAAREFGSTPELLESFSRPELAARLAEFMDPSSAEKMARALRVPLPSAFRLAQIEHDYSADGGYTCTMQLTAYLNAAADVGQG